MRLLGQTEEARLYGHQAGDTEHSNRPNVVGFLVGIKICGTVRPHTKMKFSTIGHWLLATAIVASIIFTCFQPAVTSAAPVWPTTWISLGPDPDEGGGDNHRDVLESYYQIDSEYIYLRLRTVAVPRLLANNGQADTRYKWFIDTNNDFYVQGGTAYNFDYLLYLEDTDANGVGDLYLGTAAYPAGTKITDTNIGSFQLGSGGNYVDMYLRIDQIGSLSQYWLMWATDQMNPNYAQAPNLDKVDSGVALLLVTKGSITVNKTVVGTVPAAAWQFNYTGPGSTNGSFTIPATGGQQVLSNLPLGSYTIAETMKVCYTCAPSENISAVLSASQPNATVTFTNTFGCAPTISSLEIYDTQACNGTPVISMSPLTTYYAKLTIGSSVPLSYLQTVQVTLFYDSAGTNPAAPVTGNTQTCAILTCNVAATPTWSMDPSSSTTWAIVSGSCIQPNLSATIGSWIFAFSPGKVAHESPPGNWDVLGKVTNQGAQTGELYLRDKAMNWYGEITINPPLLVSWGNVPLGLLFQDAPNPKSISISYISNGDYFEDIESSTTWQNPAPPAPPTESVTLDEIGNNPPGESMFSLKADNTAVYEDAIVVKSIQYQHINASGSITSEAGVAVNSNSLWLSVGPEGIYPVTYSGAIYYQISDR